MKTQQPTFKTLLCIVCYEAENEIAAVLDRIPQHIWNSQDYHILISDDASKDNTAQIAFNHLKGKAGNVTIQKLDVNQGYGGNQKACYFTGVQHGYDGVVLLHGDGQYPPEMIEDLIASMRRGNHVVLGSRMMVKKHALEGGMPVYKFFGNIVLTKIQNFLAGKHLHEFHTGFRAYRTDLLKNIPFELNADDFHFDTEILLQAFHFDAEIEEIPIPTFYGNEVCRVDGIKYGIKVIKASYIYRLQQLGLSVSLQYPRSSNLVYKDKTHDANSTHAIALSYIKEKQYLNRVLDIGCGPGYMAQLMYERGIKVTGIDVFKPIDNSVFENFYVRDLNDLKQAWPTENQRFDLIMMLDVLEHLNDPEHFLLTLRHSITQNETPLMLLSVPNVAFILMRLNLLLGRFNYADRGILDISHKRFFTKKTFVRMLTETGFTVISCRGIGVPFQSLSNNILFKAAGKISFYMAYLWPSLFAFQLLCEVSVKLTTKQILTQAKSFSENKE